MEKQDVFAAVCYHVLMNHHGAGILEAHPSYLAEKSSLLRVGWNAFAALDIYNKRHVIAWCNRWKFELPELVRRNFEAEEQAAAELKAKGFEL